MGFSLRTLPYSVIVLDPLLLPKMSKTLKKVFNISSKLGTTQENNNEENKKKWVPPVHPIPSSLFTLTKKERLELADVIFNQNLEQCGLLPSLHNEKQRCESNSSEESEEGKSSVQKI